MYKQLFQAGYGYTNDHVDAEDDGHSDNQRSCKRRKVLHDVPDSSLQEKRQRVWRTATFESIATIAWRPQPLHVFQLGRAAATSTTFKTMTHNAGFSFFQFSALLFVLLICLHVYFLMLVYSIVLSVITVISIVITISSTYAFAGRSEGGEGAASSGGPVRPERLL